MRIGSLCSGVGLFELGLEWAGLGETIWNVEIDAFCRRILKKHWPRAKSYDDVQATGGIPIWRNVLEPVDIICFGFPCQDISSAGEQAGLSGARSGLFYECARVVAEVGPEWVVVENVASGAKLWVDTVRGELERLGYETLPIPLEARDCGALHRRARVFIVAHSHQRAKRAQPGLAEVACASAPSGACGAADHDGLAPGGAARSDGTQGGLAAHAVGEGVGEPAPRRRIDRSRRRRVNAAGGGAQAAADAGSERREARDESAGVADPEGRRVAEGSGDAAAADFDRVAVWLEQQWVAGRWTRGVRDQRDAVAGFPGWSEPEPTVVLLVHGRTQELDDSGTGPPGPSPFQPEDLATQQRTALGNAVVPWCSEVVGHVIRQLIEEAESGS